MRRSSGGVNSKWSGGNRCGASSNRRGAGSGIDSAAATVMGPSEFGMECTFLARLVVRRRFLLAGYTLVGALAVSQVRSYGLRVGPRVGQGQWIRKGSSFRRSWDRGEALSICQDFSLHAM